MSGRVLPGSCWSANHASSGWALGEHGEWAKYQVFDVATRVPTLIHIPGQDWAQVRIEPSVSILESAHID
jgi:arylsulfatase A-like enzyme